MGLYKTFKIFKKDIRIFTKKYEQLKKLYKKYYIYNKKNINNFNIIYDSKELIGIIKYKFFGHMRNNAFYFFFKKFIKDINYYNIFKLTNLKLKKSFSKLNRHGLAFRHIYNMIYRILFKFPFLITIKPKTIIIHNLLNYNLYIFEWKNYIVNNIKKYFIKVNIINKDKFIKLIDIKNINFSNYYIYNNIFVNNFKLKKKMIYLKNNFYNIMNNIKYIYIKWNFNRYLKNYKYYKTIDKDFQWFKLIEEEEQEMINKVTINSILKIEKEKRYNKVKHIFLRYVNINNFIYKIRHNKIFLINKIKIMYNEIINKNLKTKNVKKLFYPIQNNLNNCKRVLLYTFFFKLYIIYFFWYIYIYNKLFYNLNNLFFTLWCRFYYFFNNSYDIEHNFLFYNYMYLYQNYKIYNFIEFESKWKNYFIFFKNKIRINSFMNYNIWINYFHTFIDNNNNFKNLINNYYNNYLLNLNYYNNSKYNFFYKLNLLIDLVYKKNYNVKIFLNKKFNTIWKMNSIKNINIYSLGNLEDTENLNINKNIVNNKKLLHKILKNYYNQKALYSNYLIDTNTQNNIFLDKDDIFLIKDKKIFYK